MNEAPSFESGDITNFISALQKRSKSLNRRFNFIRISDVSDEHYEIAEIMLRKARSAKSPTFRVKVWSDRWIWVDAREIGVSGWIWSFNAEGRISGSKTWADVVKCTEDLDDILSDGVAPGQLQAASELWRTVLVSGPKRMP